MVFEDTRVRGSEGGTNEVVLHNICTRCGDHG